MPSARRSAAVEGLRREFPDLDESVVLGALEESGDNVDVARSALVAAAWQAACGGAAQSGDCRAAGCDFGSAGSDVSTSSWAGDHLPRWDLAQGLSELQSGLANSIDSLTQHLGMDSFSLQLSKAYQGVASVIVGILPVELAELLYEEGRDGKDEDECTSSNEGDAAAATARAAFADGRAGSLPLKKRSSSLKAVRFEDDDSPRAHCGDAPDTLPRAVPALARAASLPPAPPSRAPSLRLAGALGSLSLTTRSKRE